MEKYPRYVTPDHEYFDPVELASETEKIICRNHSRKYTDFYATGVYGGIATGYTVGCCLRCVFCWVDWSRDFPEKYGEFYSAEEAYAYLKATAKKFKVNKLRISGAEPTLCKQHLLRLLELVENSDFNIFILETNGIKFGIDKDYVKQLSRFTKPHIRVGLKAGTPEGFAERTGSLPESYELPYKAIANLLDANVSFHVASMSADGRFMTEK
ncbi:MAG: radical SAM protein [Thermoplasmata archaeon]|nr:MAG: radical SAM protein [Thermoplasmata archaeon]